MAAQCLAVADDGTEIWGDSAKSGRAIYWAMRASVRHELASVEIQRGPEKRDLVRYKLA